MWNLPYISTIFFIELLNQGMHLLEFFDQGWLEYFGGHKTYAYFEKNSFLLDLINLKSYLYFFFFILILLMFLL